MQIPRVFYGVYRDVKRETSKVVTQLRKGRDWDEAVSASGFLDTDEIRVNREAVSGFIVLDGPDPMVGGEPHFHIWTLWWQIMEREETLYTDLMSTVFEKSLTTPWGTLGLVAYKNHFWLYPKARHRPFIRAVRTYWETLDAVGARYTNGRRIGQSLWSLHTDIKYALANLGVPTETLSAPLPPGGFAEIADLTERYLH